MDDAFNLCARSPRAMQIAVVAADAGWRLLIDQQKVGRFERRADALLCAVNIAQLSRRQGAEVELLLHDDFGELRAADARSAA